MQVTMNTTIATYSTQNTDSSKNASKPTWNGNKVYTYLEDYNDAAVSYGKQAAKYYSGITSQDGVMSVDELKKQIGEMFSGYTLTSNEPSKVVSGKHYLYIDDSQLNKMAKDPSYRAKVYGLMNREYTCANTYTLKYSDGQNVTAHVTGSIFSLSEKNNKYAGADGIPYLGSCMTDHPWSSSDSHCQVRNQSFLYDNLDPVKSAAKDRKTAAAKNTAKKTLERMRKKKLAEKKAAKKAEKKKAEEREDEIKAIFQSKYGAVTLELSQEALTAQANAKDNITGYQGMRIEIDENEDMTTETHGGAVSFNEGKRARQLSAAKTVENVQTVMSILQTDLADCQAGLESGMCDENEVNKVKAMIAKAQQRLSEVSASEGEDNSADENAFAMSMLM